MFGSSYHFDTGSSVDLTELSLQDKTFVRVVSSWGGPSDDQARGGGYFKREIGWISSASSHFESRSVKILAHRSRVLSHPSGDSMSIAVVPSSSAPRPLMPWRRYDPFFNGDPRVVHGLLSAKSGASQVLLGRSQRISCEQLRTSVVGRRDRTGRDPPGDPFRFKEGEGHE
ncbi:hypothetical protein BHE74_00024723 [Ensete ventricosum]|nr:hypothetical protein BHE74_00024723 [Ensete ventricosum]